MAIAILLVAWRLEVPKREGHVEESHWAKLKRVDFIGSAFLSGSIVALLLALNFFSSAKSWSDFVPFLSLLIGAILIVTFCLVEKYWAKEPIFPLELLAKRDTCSSYLILGCQLAAQLAVSLLGIVLHPVMVLRIRQMMSSVPLYFQVTQRAKPGEAGAYLVPAVIGNTVGGLVTGVYINK